MFSPIFKEKMFLDNVYRRVHHKRVPWLEKYITGYLQNGTRFHETINRKLQKRMTKN